MELKLHRLRMGWPAVGALNRTIVELKSRFRFDGVDQDYALNRTIVELKYYTDNYFIDQEQSLNRTIVELKLAICLRSG